MALGNSWANNCFFSLDFWTPPHRSTNSHQLSEACTQLPLEHPLQLYHVQVEYSRKILLLPRVYSNWRSSRKELCSNLVSFSQDLTLLMSKHCSFLKLTKIRYLWCRWRCFIGHQGLNQVNFCSCRHWNTYFSEDFPTDLFGDETF